MPKFVAPLSHRAVMGITKVGFTSLGGAVGLYLYVTPAKRRYYVYRYKEKNGNRSMISLGPIEMIDLAQARAQAVEWRMRIRNGESPSVIRNGERRERRKAEI